MNLAIHSVLEHPARLFETRIRESPYVCPATFVPSGILCRHLIGFSPVQLSQKVTISLVKTPMLRWNAGANCTAAGPIRWVSFEKNSLGALKRNRFKDCGPVAFSSVSVPHSRNTAMCVQLLYNNNKARCSLFVVVGDQYDNIEGNSIIMWVNRVKCLIFSQILFLRNPLSRLFLLNPVQFLIILNVKVPKITVAWGVFDSPASCIANILPQVITTNTSSPSPQSSPLPSDTILSRCRCVGGATVSMGSLGDLMVSDDDDGL